MGIYATKSKWQHGLDGVVAICASQHIHPDVLTFGALALSFIAAFAFSAADANHAWLWLVPPCLILRLIFNLMDGQVARAQNLANAWGEVKNEFGDRVADATIFLGLCFGGYADTQLAALSIVLILCVSYLGILGKAIGGARIYAGVFGKGDRMISLAIFTLWIAAGQPLVNYNWYLQLAILASLITIIQRLKMINDYTKSHV
ncbi:MAG: CDP-alcohol phosphatidyltransferase family protein [Chloroflexi bacterium]|nr:CDP-alcohol phosphatidyltransferase family protein [Chloroflexota bacterium]